MCMQAFTKSLAHASIVWMHMLHCLFLAKTHPFGVGGGANPGHPSHCGGEGANPGTLTYIYICMYIYTSADLCIYMHRLQWSLIAKKSECLVDPISMLLSQLLSQLRPQLSSSSYMFEDIKMGITSSRKPGRMLDRENTWFCRHGRTLDREMLAFVSPDVHEIVKTRGVWGGGARAAKAA